jgi:phage baseplate assembly protein W
MVDVDFPFGFDATGRTRSADREDHVRDLVEQVLFTAPGGERVNRPQFGSGLLGLVFEPNGSALAAATQARVEGALQLWLADVVQVESVQVRAEESTLAVTVAYVVRVTQERRVERIRSAGVP